MISFSDKNHWENVYTRKTPEQVSWTQPVPHTSLRMIEDLLISKEEAIIDIGGGDSRLADHLIHDGYKNISVLDISETAINKAKKRLDDHAEKINWIVSDIRDYKPDSSFMLWHDRAAFHFLTSAPDIEDYCEKVKKSVKGFLIIACFSDLGPEKCSGLPIKQYDENSMKKLWEDDFEMISSFRENHTTPFQTTQEFLFSCFKRK